MLQYCQKQVTYLGQTIGYNLKSITEDRVLVIMNYPQPQTIRKEKKQNESIEWTAPSTEMFCSLMQAPALGIPDYTKKVYLFEQASNGYMSAVLAQKTSMGHKPLGYYSAKQDYVVGGLFLCEQALAAAALAVEKSSSITLGHPVTLYAEHSLYAVFEKAKSCLTPQRRSRYEVIQCQFAHCEAFYC